MPKNAEAKPTGMSAVTVVDDLLPRIARRRKFAERLGVLYAERATQAPWGAALPEDISSLEDKGLYVGLFWRSKKGEIHPPEGAAAVDLAPCGPTRRKQRSCAVAVVSREPFAPGHLPT
ncbi:MAG: hypothetical protein ACOCWR_10040, partial [Oceanidesulfovibrio sp.]